MNVLDQYKEKTPEEIKAIYESNSCPAAAAMFHWTGDFNVSQLIRNANFFGLKEVFYIGGTKQYDRRGCVGTHNYIRVTFCKTEEMFWNIIKNNYIPIAIENNISFVSQNVLDFTYPKNPIFLFGEEQKGLDDSVLLRCNNILTIPAYGTVRSINVGSCSAVVMSSYRNFIQKHDVSL